MTSTYSSLIGMSVGSIFGVILCLLLPVSTALSVGLAGDAPPGDSGSESPQLARSRGGSQDDSDSFSEGINLEFQGCSAEDRPALAKKFQNAYRTEWDWRVKAAFKSVDGPAYLTVGEARNTALLRNFLAHAKNVTAVDKIHMTVVNAQLDVQGMIECEKAREAFDSIRLDIRCVDLGGWLPVEFFGKRVNSGPDTCVYNMIIWSKPEIFLTAVKASQHDVMMVDTDVMIYHDLFRLGRQILDAHQNAKLVVSLEQHGRRNPNTGVVLATKDGIELLERWADHNVEFVNSRFGDQAAFGSLSKYAALFWKRLGVFSTSEVGQCGIRGEWATHYNCLGGRKGGVMRNRGDWSPDAFKLGQRQRGSRHKKSQARPLMPDELSELVDQLRAAGEWWLDE